jgi:hypothetical protein
MDPVALMPGRWEHVTERRPPPQRTVADRDHRRPHAAAPKVPQQLRPRLGRLPLTVTDRDQLLAAVGAYPHDHQTAQPGLLQPHPEVDPSAQTYTSSRSDRSRWLNAW